MRWIIISCLEGHKQIVADVVYADSEQEAKDKVCYDDTCHYIMATIKVPEGEYSIYVEG